MERRVIGKILGSPCIKDWCLFVLEQFKERENGVMEIGPDREENGYLVSALSLITCVSSKKSLLLMSLYM